MRLRLRRVLRLFPVILMVVTMFLFAFAVFVDIVGATIYRTNDTLLYEKATSLWGVLNLPNGNESFGIFAISMLGCAAICFFVASVHRGLMPALVRAAFLFFAAILAFELLLAYFDPLEMGLHAVNAAKGLVVNYVWLVSNFTVLGVSAMVLAMLFLRKRLAPRKVAVVASCLVLLGGVTVSSYALHQGKGAEAPDLPVCHTLPDYWTNTTGVIACNQLQRAHDIAIQDWPSSYAPPIIQALMATGESLLALGALMLVLTRLDGRGTPGLSTHQRA